MILFTLQVLIIELLVENVYSTICHSLYLIDVYAVKFWKMTPLLPGVKESSNESCSCHLMPTTR